MARGWESKAVESQIEEAGRKSGDRDDRLGPDQVELRQRREGLLLARARLLQDLETARHARYRDMLQQALEHIERELGKVP
jgi:hypothetical protein